MSFSLTCKGNLLTNTVQSSLYASSAYLSIIHIHHLNISQTLILTCFHYLLLQCLFLLLDWVDRLLFHNGWSLFLDWGVLLWRGSGGTAGARVTLPLGTAVLVMTVTVLVSVRFLLMAASRSFSSSRTATSASILSPVIIPCRLSLFSFLLLLNVYPI